MVSITELLRMPTGVYCVLLSDYRDVEEAKKSHEETNKKLEQALEDKNWWVERALDAEAALENAVSKQAT